MEQRFKVVVTDFITEPLDVEREILGDLALLVALDARSEDDLVGRIEDADAIMLYHFIKMTEQSIQRLRQCRLIVRCGVGIDGVDSKAARARNIPVANVPDYGTEEVADTAISLTLALARGTHLLNSRLRRGQGPWSYTQVKPLRRLRGSVFGVVGIGRIGTAAALRAKSLGMDVVFYDPYVPDGYEKSLGVRRAATLEELAQQVHILSLHCPLTPETQYLVDQGVITTLSEGAIVVNTARAGIVDTSALLQAIEHGRLGGAGLDVLETEPPDDTAPLISAWRDPNHPAHERIIINPHAAFYSEEGLRDMRVKGSENCRRVLCGQSPRNVVN